MKLTDIVKEIKSRPDLGINWDNPENFTILKDNVYKGKTYDTIYNLDIFYVLLTYMFDLESDEDKFVYLLPKIKANFGNYTKGRYPSSKRKEEIKNLILQGKIKFI